VTGGAVRIGRAFTEAFLARGAEVVVHYQHSQVEAEGLSDWTVCAELGDEQAVSRMMDEVGEVDVLVNNASLFTRDCLQAATPERAAREVQVNLLAPLELIRRFAQQGKRGAVLNLLDRRIKAHDTSCVPYTLSKVGLAELTRLAALELAPDIRVNAVAPGPVLPSPSGSVAEFHERKGVIPMERVPKVEEVVQAGLFLLENASITGQVVFVDGGQHLLGNGVL
jgi:NAD(P)-dependent dehydrogenase (short-subunit alcohol dehydrogenase family)